MRRSELPARQDRPPARGARRLPHRLPQPRRGDPHHPRRGRAEAGADEALQAHRRAGRGDPQHAAALAAQARGDRDPQAEHDELTQGAGAISRRCSSSDEQAVETDRRGDRRGDARSLSPRRPRSAAAAPTFAEAPDIDDRGDPAGDDRERADHRHPLREGLDPRAEGPSRRHGRARSSRRRRAEASRSTAQTTDKLLLAHDRRQGLHARRPTSCRAGAATASRCA